MTSQHKYLQWAFRLDLAFTNFFFLSETKFSGQMQEKNLNEKTLSVPLHNKDTNI